MINQNNLILTRTEPNGQGGYQFLYKVGDYGVVVGSKPQEEIHHIHWEADIVKYISSEPIKYEVCHTTELASKTLLFRNDSSMNEFLEKAFTYLKELSILEGMIPEEERSKS
ncbi:MAG: hypothetical protein G3M78_08860 [Candidatus Nitrohelix vancouverensis]|uniref:Uncharacterized protein n=1 Tax=Candidatus Nitrohelix vancouverensis TaxID=2705534 RepID=A0A7T0C2T5_9BACT|nr:MAG: hypothetical protein G3M78_08860 [Candidatus Nitrohelix vancouverensis]